MTDTPETKQPGKHEGAPEAPRPPRPERPEGATEQPRPPRSDSGERRGPSGPRPESGERRPAGDRGDRGDRGERPDRGDRGDRGPRTDRGDRGDRGAASAGRGGPRRRRFPRRKVCHFCLEKAQWIDYKDARKLRRFVTDRGKILPRRVTGTCAHHQRILTMAIKRARHIALLPFKAE